MINFDYITKENVKKHNPKWPQIPNHSYRILIIQGSRSGKTNALFKLIGCQPDMDPIYLYVKDPYDAKYQLFIHKPKGIDLKECNDSKAFIEDWNDMDDIYEEIE